MTTTPLLEAVTHLVGFATVLFALAALWGLTALMSRLVAAGTAPGPAAGPGPEGPFALGVSDEDVVVITAAAAVVLKARHRIVAITEVSSLWSRAGRRAVQDSHRIR